MTAALHDMDATFSVMISGVCLPVALEKNGILAFELRLVECSQDAGYDYEKVLSQKVTSR